MLKKLARDNHSNLIQKFVNYGQKSFITLAPSDRNWQLIFFLVGNALDIEIVFAYQQNSSLTKMEFSYQQYSSSCFCGCLGDKV
jgi:hypothetical protein